MFPKHQEAEHEALDRGETGRIGNRVYKLKEKKDGGLDIVGSSDYSNKTQQTYGDLSKGQQRQIAATDSDQSKFKIDLDKQNEAKAYQERQKRQNEENRQARLLRDKKLNREWGRTNNISDEMVEAISEINPTSAFQDAKDKKKAVAKIMSLKKEDGTPRFKNFEDYRHWAMAYRANKGSNEEE